MAVAVTPFLESLQRAHVAGVDGKEVVAVSAHHDEAAFVRVVVGIQFIVDGGDGSQYLQIRIPREKPSEFLHLFQETVDVFPVAVCIYLDGNRGGVIVQEHGHFHAVVGIGGLETHVLMFSVHVVTCLGEHVDGGGAHQPFDDVARGGAESRGKFFDFFVGFPG